MRYYTVGKARLIVAAVVILLTLPYVLCLVGAIPGTRLPSPVTGDPRVAGFFFLALDVGLLIFACRKPGWFCCDCGQYMGGDRTAECFRCGCNMFTTSYTGSGRTTRYTDRDG